MAASLRKLEGVLQQWGWWDTGPGEGWQCGHQGGSGPAAGSRAIGGGLLKAVCKDVGRMQRNPKDGSGAVATSRPKGTRGGNSYQNLEERTVWKGSS